jgi:3D (Asp-Asp-Asp) domain-containing protein
MLSLLLTLTLAAAPTEMTMSATAFAQSGITASGIQAQPRIAAAETRILPLGTVIRVRGAGRYSGTYVVADTGRTISGRQIDRYVRTPAEAHRFGRQKVRARILRRPQ